MNKQNKDLELTQPHTIPDWIEILKMLGFE